MAVSDFSQISLSPEPCSCQQETTDTDNNAANDHVHGYGGVGTDGVFRDFCLVQDYRQGMSICVFDP